jgi:MATE family multidrug resistance protein
MFTDLVVNGINVIASIFLSLGIPGTSFEGIGFSGIAWGTVLAQYSGLIFALVVIFIK